MSHIELTAERLRAWPLPQPGDYADKDERGRVLAIGGCVEAPGGLMLAGEAALRAGAGKVKLGAPRAIAPLLAAQFPEARVLRLDETPEGDLSPRAADGLDTDLRHCDALLAGPGMLDSEAAGELTSRLAAMACGPVVLDAAALAALREPSGAVRGLAGRLVITPHAGEMSRLCGAPKAEIEADPARWARQAASDLGAVVVLKGAQTFIVSPDGSAWRYGSECPGLGISGSGDVLAGLLTGLVARGAALDQAACWAVFVPGLCGRRLARKVAPLGFLARELPGQVAPAIEAVACGSAMG